MELFSRNRFTRLISFASLVPYIVVNAQILPRRIAKELQQLKENPVPGIVAKPDENNIRYIHVAMNGPVETPYEGGTFELELFLPEEYPMKAPAVRFITRIYHPNIDKLGRICLDVLKDKWTPALQIRTILLSIQALLSAPNPDDPLDNKIAELWKTDEHQAVLNAQEFTALHAMKKNDEMNMKYEIIN